mmetsp:Transcript_12741/g.31105  ORF Transcript_12741/g.31105 Transcript_12741/m.31105 type:complete len:112 (+) Transcript_12741:64-399(+)
MPSAIPKPPSSPSKKRDCVIDCLPHNFAYSSQTSQILEDLYREIETDEWKENAIKKNWFSSPGVRKATSGGGGNLVAMSNGTNNGKDQKNTPPTFGVSALSLSPGKRMRLK